MPCTEKKPNLKQNKTKNNKNQTKHTKKPKQKKPKQQQQQQKTTHNNNNSKTNQKPEHQEKEEGKLLWSHSYSKHQCSCTPSLCFNGTFFLLAQMWFFTLLPSSFQTPAS